MKICFFLGDIHGSGGISRVTWILANAMCERHEIHVLSNWENKNVRYRYQEAVRLACLFQERKSNSRRLVPLVMGVRRYLRENGIDVLICAGEIYYPVCVSAVAFTQTKLICWEHSNASVRNEHKLQSVCRRTGARNADRIVTLTKADARLYKEKYHISNVQAVYNPIDGRLLTGVDYDEGSKKIISVGRLCYAKNFELLADIANLILHKNPDWTWHIYGEGECREAIQAKITGYGLEGRLVLMGNVDGLYDRYAEYAFLVMTSRYEGFPMVLLESMARGVPAIAFDILTGPNEIIEDGKTGRLVRPGDAAGMAEAVQDLIDGREERRRMSRACVNKRDQYACGKIVEQWMEILDSLG